MVPALGLLLYLSPLPTPPSAEPRAYRAWLHKQPKAMQRKIAAYCADHGGDYESVCNGIGPLGIAEPPRDALDEDAREDWLATLTVPQRNYVAAYCTTDDAARATSELCGGTPIVVAFRTDYVQLASGAHPDVPVVTTPWMARDLDGDGTLSGDEISPGAKARPGFAALFALDGNHDGKLDDRDPVFASLLVWANSPSTPALKAVVDVIRAP